MRALIFTAFLLCLGTNIYAQRDTIYDVDHFYEHLFDHINTQQLNSGFLLDKAYPFTNIKRFNGAVHDSSALDFMQLKLAYSTFYNMHLQRQRPLAEHSLQMAYYHRRERSDTIYLAGLASRYHRLKTEIWEAEMVYLEDQKLQLADGMRTADIFEDALLLAISPLKEKVKGAAHTFYFARKDMLAFGEMNALSWQVNFDDGQGYRALQYDQAYSITYNEGGSKQLRFKAERGNNTYQVNSKLEVEIEQAGILSISEIPDFIQYFTATRKYPASPSFSSGLVSVSYGESSNQKLDKPILIVEGFDETDIMDLDYVKDYGHFYEEKLNRIPNFRNNLQSQGYDIVHLNFDNTTDYMQNSAYLVQRVLNWLRQHPDREEEIVVLGLSSGGIIARYALADWEQTFSHHHDVRLNISFDSGHDGNNIPVGVQYFLDHMNEIKITGVKLSSIITKIAQAHELLNTPAARQMLNVFYDQSRSLNISFFNELHNMGLPKNCRNITVANGSGAGQNQSVSAGGYLYNQGVFDYIPLNLNFNIFSLCINIPVSTLLLGIYSSVKIRLLNNSSSTEVYKGQFHTVFPGNLLMVFSSRTKNHQAQASYSAAPGATFLAGGCIEAVLPQVGFVPTKSALGIMGRQNPSIYGSTAVFNGNNICATPFDNWYAPTANEQHGEFNAGNTNFMWSELHTNQSSLQCAALCETGPLSGPSLVCTSNSTFTLSNVPSGASVSWSRSSNLTQAASNNSSITVRAPSSSTSGTGWVRATISTGCGSFDVQENVWVGKPYAFNIQGPSSLSAGSYANYSVTPWNSQHSFAQQGVNATSTSWSFSHPPTSQGWSCFGCSGSSVSVQAGSMSTQLSAQLTNACGYTLRNIQIYVPQEDCPPGGCEEPFFVYPNPVSDIVSFPKNWTV